VSNPAARGGCQLTEYSDREDGSGAARTRGKKNEGPVCFGSVASEVSISCSHVQVQAGGWNAESVAQRKSQQREAGLHLG
jgi:hypothetical protein